MLAHRRRDIAESKDYYFERIMPLLRPVIESREEHVRLRGLGYTTLVSLMGFSPETTVHSALILRPQ